MSAVNAESNERKNKRKWIKLARQAAAYWGRMGGKSKSATKAEAVRKNGLLGGRPRKNPKPSARNSKSA
jgi:hypothetical protein